MLLLAVFKYVVYIYIFFLLYLTVNKVDYFFLWCRLDLGVVVPGGPCSLNPCSYVIGLVEAKLKCSLICLLASILQTDAM